MFTDRGVSIRKEAKMHDNQWWVFLLVSMLLTIPDFASAADNEWRYEWARTFGSSQDDDIKAMDVDSEGHIYVVGTYSGNFDGYTHRGGGDVFVRKYALDGNIIWTRTFGGASFDLATAIRVHESNDEILIGGAFYGKVDFDPGPSEYMVTSSGEAMYLLSLTLDGAFRWIKLFDSCKGKPGGGGITDIISDEKGNIYYCGFFGSETEPHGTLDFDPSKGKDLRETVGSIDLFVSKLDSKGKYLWTQTFGERTKRTAAFALQTYPGKVYVIGGTGGGIGQEWYSGASPRNAFVLKLTDSGTPVWKRAIEGFSSPVPVDIAVDENERIFVCGTDSASTKDTLKQLIPFLAAPSGINTQIFVVAFDASAEQLWSYTTGSWGINGAYSLALDSQDAMYVLGGFQGKVDFNPIGSGDVRTSKGASVDIFITKLARTGRYLYTQTLGSMSEERGQRIVIDPFYDTLYLAGFFKAGLDFDWTGGSDVHQSNGQKDAFLCRYEPANRAPVMTGPPKGPNHGTTGKKYRFKANATDPEGDSLKYRFDWGDGKRTKWSAGNTASHLWKAADLYCVKAQAKDTHSAVSDWSACKNVSIVER